MNKSIVMFLALILLLSISAAPVFSADMEQETRAGVDTAYYFDHTRGAEGDGGFVAPSYSPVKKPDNFNNPLSVYDEGRDLGSGWGGAELQAWVEHRITMPVLTGNGPLTKDNNVKFIFRGNLAPVVVYASARAVLTPVAFLNFEAGYSVGTGWSGIGFNGIGLNTDGSGNSLEDPFPGAVMETWFSGTFQFDLAAVMPGEWNHVVVLANGKIQNQYFTAADEYDPWTWKADSGENFNGNLFKGTYVLGYQMPLKVNMVALMVETEQYLGDVKDLSPMDDGGFGSDFTEVTLGPLANIAFDDHNSLTVLLQFQSDKRYTEDTIHNNWFVTREYDSTFVRMHRLAFSYTYTF